MKPDQNDPKYLSAKKRVSQLKAFYTTLMLYIIFISMLAGLNYYVNQWRNPWFLWAAFGWGIGLFFQAMKVFNNTLFFGKDWEQRKMKQFMEEEEESRRHNNL